MPKPLSLHIGISLTLVTKGNDYEQMVNMNPEIAGWSRVQPH